MHETSADVSIDPVRTLPRGCGLDTGAKRGSIFGLRACTLLLESRQGETSATESWTTCRSFPCTTKKLSSAEGLKSFLVIRPPSRNVFDETEGLCCRRQRTRGAASIAVGSAACWRMRGRFKHTRRVSVREEGWPGCRWWKVYRTAEEVIWVGLGFCGVL